MSAERQVAVRDLVEEGKKRAVILVICAVGLSYLMSLTSSSVLVNLPVAATLIIILRYISLDFEMRRRAAVCSSMQPSDKSPSKKKAPLGPQVAAGKSDWRRKVDSPVVEDAIDHFARHLISEWVTNLWYSRLTPDKEGPEELVQIMNNVLGEISYRSRSINLIDLLTRDIIHLLCTHLELFRASQIKIDRKHLGSLTIEQRDVELKHILAVENKLHPALFSAEAEHKVLQHLMDGLISFTFKPEDLQCSFFRLIARELLACAVIRPVLNLANPRFINERIESVVISVNKTGKGSITIQETSQAKTPSKTSSDQSSGVELVQLKNNQSQTAAGNSTIGNHNGRYVVKDPLLSVDARSTCSWDSLPPDSSTVDGSNNGIQRHRSGGEWGDMLDIISHRKTQALAPENFENMWAKGRNFIKKESVVGQVNQRSALGSSETLDILKLLSTPKESDITNISSPDRSILLSGAKDLPTGHKDINMPASCSVTHMENNSPDLMALEDAELESSSSHSAEEEEDDDNEEISNVTGLDSPGTKVWDGRKNRNDSASHIRHPLESSDGSRAKKTGKGHAPRQRLSRVLSNRKRLRSDSEKVHVWQELRRTSFSSGDGQDILTSLIGHTVAEDSSDESELERLGRSCSGASASSSAPISLPQSHGLAIDSAQNSLLADSFFRLKCEVVGANVVKSGSKTFAVYSISVTDVNKNIWSIKRRFRHFEELHRRLKEYPLYNLHLPPKHFLSTGLDVPVIQERCKLLDIYLKSLLQIPTISGIIEVWDFLSVDSQTYMFSNSISIIETLSVDLDDKPPEKPIKNSNSIGPVVNPIYHSRGSGMKESPAQTKPNSVVDESRCVRKNKAHSLAKQPAYESRKQLEDSGSDSETRAQRAVSPVTVRKFGKTAKGTDNEGSRVMLPDTVIDPTLPTESPLQCVPPNLSAPILDLVDVIFQLQDGGWIRRKVFWVAKQVLQLGMGDAFDDWLIDKIQRLRKGPVIASGIGRIEQILWPDGIFITKHPKRQRPSSGISSQNVSHGQHPMPTSSSPKKDNLQKQNGEESILSFDELQIREANRRAKFVYDLMIENAPAAIVGVIGRKEYEQCAKDLYFFLQSSVCLKQLAYDLLELLLVSTFPELDGVFAQLNHERQKFGAFKPS